MPDFSIGNRLVGENHPTYFIADIAANHDGDLQRAQDLISLAKAVGADAAKFQHFRAPRIVSDYGFRQLGGQLSHQKNWRKSIYEVYKDASLDWEWTQKLAEHCEKESIHFFSSPYDAEAVDHLEAVVPAYKIGSGDITWHAIIEYIAKKPVPVLLATGASNIQEVIDAVDIIRRHNNRFCVMQCNTNYTGSLENFRHIALRVLDTYRILFPDAVLGLSDHTPGHATVLGAVALGARVVEKHLTDDNTREGPDHPFSMNPVTWREMVERTRELEIALGSTVKRVEANERDTVVVQRRCIRAARDLSAGTVLADDDLECLRPAPPDALGPNRLNLLLGRRLKVPMEFGRHFTGSEVE